MRYSVPLVFASLSFVAGCSGAPMTSPPVHESSVARVAHSAFARRITPNQVDTDGDDWPEFRRDDQRTGNNPYQTAITTANVATLAPKWTKTTTGVFSSPLVVNGIVYQGQSNGKLSAWNVATGANVWSFKSTGSFIGSGYYSNGTLYISARGNPGQSVPSKVYSINATNGAENWVYDVGALAAVSSSPMVTNGVVYSGTDAKNYNKDECDSNDQLIALDPSSGALVSSLNLLPAGADYTGADIWASPMIDTSGNLYVGTGPECVVKAQPLAYSDAILQVNQTQPTMSVNWSFQSFDGPGDNKLDFDFGATPIYVNGMVVDTGKDGYTYALDPATGALIWDTKTGMAIGSSATDGNYLYIPTMASGCAVGATCGAFTALNLTDGSTVWSIPIIEGNYGFSDLAAPAVSNGIVFASFNGYIWALDSATGATLWSYPTPNSVVFSGLTVVNGGLLVGEYTNGSTYFCFTPGGQ
jgi:eukaryotic-like serine/threonine-protein kinase